MDIEGVLKVSDADLFWTAVEKGLSRFKDFGCGMLELEPIVRKKTIQKEKNRMNEMKNELKYKGIVLDVHRIQSFPVSCLNRDDQETPKSCYIGGTIRSRISSQCLKRAVRMQMHQDGMEIAMRTRNEAGLVASACRSKVTDEKMRYITQLVSALKEPGRDDQFLYLVPAEVNALARHVDSLESVPEKPERNAAEEVLKGLSTGRYQPLSGLDVALFGRMMWNAPDLDVPAAVSTAHAYTTHTVSFQKDYLSAIDDFVKGRQTARLEDALCTSETFYLYSGISLDTLEQNLSGAEQVPDAVAAYLHALYEAKPVGRRTTYASQGDWDYARIILRKGNFKQPIFDAPVKADNGSGYVSPSIKALDNMLDRQKSLSGSRYGGIDEFRYGLDPDYSIDRLVSDVCSAIEGIGGDV